MLFGEILAPVLSVREDTEFIDSLAILSKNINTNITIYYAQTDPNDVVQNSTFGLMSGFEGEFINKLKEENSRTWEYINNVCKTHEGFSCERAVGSIENLIIPRAALCDMIAVDGAHMLSHQEYYRKLEISLMNSGVCGLVIGAPKRINMENITIAWNGSVQAARAVKAALPFLKKAKRVTILQLQKNGQSNKSSIYDPQVLANMLARNEISTELLYGKQTSNDIAQTILEIAQSDNADAIVAGLYSTKRSTEIIFGGTSRSLLKHIKDINLILSH